MTRKKQEPGGIKALAVFMICLLVFGTCGWALYAKLTEQTSPLNVLTGTLGGSITIGTTSSPDSLDIRTQSGNAVTQALLGNVYESLLSRDQNNKPQAGIADSWKVSDDGLRYTFTINNGKTFSNGDALNANDVVWSLQQTIERKYQGADRLTNLASVTNNGNNTVIITLRSPNPDLAWALSGRAGIVYDKDARYSYSTEAVGSGPFVVDEWDKDASLVLKANARYWGQRAKTGTITLQYYRDDAAAVSAFGKGEVDAVTPIAATQKSALQKASDADNVQIVQGTSTQKLVLGFNNGADSILSDKRYRQGMRYAIDREALMNALGGGQTLGGPLTSLEPGYEDLTGMYPHNDDKATELLSYFFYVSKRRTLTFVYPQRYGSQVGELLKQQVYPMNVDLDVKMVDDATWQKTVVQQKQYDFTLFDMSDSHDLATLMDGDNYIGYDSPEAQTLWKKTQASDSDSAYESNMKALARQISTDSPVDWLGVRQPITAYRNTITGMPKNMTDQLLPLRDVQVR